MRIVVIGAGLLGISTAFFLRNSGHETIVIDRNTGPGLDTSFANGGMLTPSQAAPWNSPGIPLKLLRWFGGAESPLKVHPRSLLSLFSWGTSFLKNSSSSLYKENFLKNLVLTEYSLKILQETVQQFSVSYDRSCKGTLKLFRTSYELHQAQKIFESVGLNRISYELLDNNQVIRLEPSLSPVKDQIAGGIYYPNDEAGDAYKFCNELSMITNSQGVKFKYDTSIHRLIRRGKLISGLDTSSGFIEADYYILAAGSHSTKLASKVGISLPIRPVRGYSVTFYSPPMNLSPNLPVIDDSRHIAITPFPDRLRVSGAAEFYGYDKTVNEKKVKMMINYFNKLFPELSALIDFTLIDSWAGLRPYCADGVPVLGNCEVSNLLLNTGHGHLGWTMAMGSGKLISDLICRGKTDLDLRPYSIDRFNR